MVGFRGRKVLTFYPYPPRGVLQLFKPTASTISTVSQWFRPQASTLQNREQKIGSCESLLICHASYLSTVHV